MFQRRTSDNTAGGIGSRATRRLKDPGTAFRGRCFLAKLTMGGQRASKGGNDQSIASIGGQNTFLFLSSHGRLHAARCDEMAAHLREGSGPSSQPGRHAIFIQIPRASTMDTKSQPQKRQDGALSSLNAAIEAMNLAKEISSITPAKAVFGSVSVVLTMIRVRFPPLQRSVPRSHIARIQWLMIWISSNSGYPALMYVEPSIGG